MIDRLRTIVDESCGLQPADLTPEELFTLLERKLFELRRDGEVERRKVERIAALFNGWANGDPPSYGADMTLTAIGDVLGVPF